MRIACWALVVILAFGAVATSGVTQGLLAMLGAVLALFLWSEGQTLPTRRDRRRFRAIERTISDFERGVRPWHR